MKQILSKFLLLLVFSIVFTSSWNVGYSYFDDLYYSDSETIPVGEWYIGISTAQEFYNFATRSDSTTRDRYYLENDIDFSSFTWTLDSTNNKNTFKGLFDGNGYALSNLTISTTSSTYNYLGIFPRLEDATVKNLILDDVHMVIDSSVISSKSYRSGLISGDIRGTTVIENITITNSTVMANKGAGAGGIVGYIVGTSTDVTITNIKASNLKVFNNVNNAGGIVGQINKNVPSVTISDIDIQTDVFSAASSSYVGGLVGRTEAGVSLDISTSIVELNPQNTFVSFSNYLAYAKRHNGGLVGYNLGSTITFTDTFFTGNLITKANSRAKNIGTAIGKNTGTYTLTRSYYSQVQFKHTDGNLYYTPDSAATGIFTTVVNTSTMPSQSWWNTFSTSFDDDFWSQDSSGRLYLVR